MKNVVIINNGNGGSTGNIAKNLQRFLIQQGYNCIFCYGRGGEGNGVNTYRIDSDIELRFHAFMTRLTGLQGFYSKSATTRLLSKLDIWNVDTIYVVCIHGYYINEAQLYRYISDHNVRLVHIMIDEYAYTGKCAYRDGCNRFMKGCGRCLHKQSYPSSYLIDGSASVYNMKMRAYSNLNNAVFVGPQFVVDQARTSPLFKNIKTVVLDEAIDMDVFYPRQVDGIKKNLGIEDNKYVVVSVVPYDGEKNDRKGGRFFIDLARMFEYDERYVFVHVGYRCKKKEALPSNYIKVGFVNDLNHLAEFFSLGDLFVFPSLLDTMPNACLDALACGTPILCFDVSGMPYIANSDVGTFVEPGNVEKMAEVVQKSDKKTIKIIEKCRNYAMRRYDCREYNKKLVNIAININK